MNKSGIDGLGMRALTGSLYREDNLSERIRLFFKWTKEYSFTQAQFDELVYYCNICKVEKDVERRNG